MTTETPTADAEIGRLVENMRGFKLHADITEVLLTDLRLNKNPLPWDKRPQVEQQRVIDHVTELADKLIWRVVETVAADGREPLNAVLEKVQITDKVTATLTISKESDQLSKLVKATTKNVQIVLADHEQYKQGEIAKASPDQGDMLEGDDEPEAEAPEAPEEAPVDEEQPVAAKAHPPHPAGPFGRLFGYLDRIDKKAVDDALDNWDLLIEHDKIEIKEITKGKDGAEKKKQTGFYIYIAEGGVLQFGGTAKLKRHRQSESVPKIKALLDDFNLQLAEEAQQDSQEEASDAETEPKEWQPPAVEEEAPAEESPEPADEAAPDAPGEPDGGDLPDFMDRRKDAKPQAGALSENDGEEHDAKALAVFNQEGQQAFADGEDRENNPYANDTDPNRAWDAGYAYAVKADLSRKHNSGGPKTDSPMA